MTKNIFTFLVNTVLLGMIVLGALIVLSLMPVPGRFHIYVVRSGSMEPAIGTGSLVFVKPQGGYAVGDIVTWRPISGKTTVTHRIVETKEQDGRAIFFTKGDANEAMDEAIGEKQIIGKTLFSLPYLGYPVSFAKTRVGFFFLVILPAFLIVLDEVNNIRRELEKHLASRRRRDPERSEPVRPGFSPRITYPSRIPRPMMDGIIRIRPIRMA